jgi:hypothetical protein
MKVRATKLYFDGHQRQRPGSVFEINNDKWKQGDRIPEGKKIGDYKYLSTACMEIVDDKIPSVSLRREVISSSGPKTSEREVI